MNKDTKEPREIYKFSKNEAIDLNSSSASLHLENIVDCEKKIKDLEKKKK